MKIFLEWLEEDTVNQKGVWHIGGKYKRAPKRRGQKGGATPLGLLASIGTPILGEIA